VVSLLEAQFIDRSYDLDGSVISWSWNFGDGGPSDQRSPLYAFQRPGIYQVNLTVTDDRGWMGTTTSSITVLNRPPQVNMTVPQGELWSLEILDFNASGDDPDGAVAAFFWDMGDGDLMEGENVTHAYLAPGNYTVTVTCKDDFGGENSASSSITILNLNPRAEVRVDHGEHPLELALTAQAEDDDGSIASYDWNFGDGTFGNGATVRHRYQDEGSYEVTLTVVDDAGGSVETRTLVTVNLASISLTNPELRYDADRGWTVSVDLVNEGAIPVGVTLLVDAGGTRFLTERNISGLSSIHVDLELANFKAGNITVKVLSPDGWDSDLQDNVWAAKAEIAEPFPYWLVGLGILAIGVVVAVLLVRRR
jgi:PKD repeat protein